MADSKEKLLPQSHDSLSEEPCSRPPTPDGEPPIHDGDSEEQLLPPEVIEKGPDSLEDRPRPTSA